MVMHDPAHPDEVIRELCLEPLELSVTEAAKALGVTQGAFRAALLSSGSEPRNGSQARQSF